MVVHQARALARCASCMPAGLPPAPRGPAVQAALDATCMCLKVHTSPLCGSRTAGSGAQAVRWRSTCAEQAAAPGCMQTWLSWHQLEWWLGPPLGRVVWGGHWARPRPWLAGAPQYVKYSAFATRRYPHPERRCPTVPGCTSRHNLTPRLQAANRWRASAGPAELLHDSGGRRTLVLCPARGPGEWLGREGAVKRWAARNQP